MPEERPRTHVVRFIAVTVAVSLGLGIPLLVVGGRASSPLVLGLVYSLIAMLPALSLIVAAVGATLSRKLRYLLGLFIFMAIFDLIAVVTGWQSLVTATKSLSSGQPGALVALYRLILLAGPLVTVILFAGKKPSAFWTRDG